MSARPQFNSDSRILQTEQPYLNSITGATDGDNGRLTFDFLYPDAQHFVTVELPPSLMVALLKAWWQWRDDDNARLEGGDA